MSAMTDELTDRHDGAGFSFRHPPAARLDTAVDERTVDSVVLDLADRPVVVAAAVDDSPLDARALQVPGQLGALLSMYRDKGGYDELWYGRLPVSGSDAAEAAEIRYGGGDPRQAVLVAARIAGRRIVTLQVHFPPSTAAVDRPLALAIVESLTVTV
jgi:hypothetical protein